MTLSTVSDSDWPSATNASALRSTKSRTGSPAAWAASTFFSELSSVPAWNLTFSPRPRPARASTSACTSSSANPMCGRGLT
jgi:hypothetical protein